MTASGAGRKAVEFAGVEGRTVRAGALGQAGAAGRSHHGPTTAARSSEGRRTRSFFGLYLQAPEAARVAQTGTSPPPCQSQSGNPGEL
jgi:hypothetical protein